MDKYNTLINDPYLIHGTECLKNIRGIANINELERVERDITRENIVCIKKQNSPYNLNTMRYIHQTLFSSLYQWAGEIRSVRISKGTTEFCFPEYIEKESSKLFAKLNEDFSTKMGYWKLESAADRLAFHYGELNVLHPFREGNGRTQRILFEFIAQDIGYSIRWLENSDQWINANISAFTRDHKELSEIFLDILEPA